MFSSASCISTKVNNIKPSQGAVIESYLAEEAIGLAKSLDWQVIKGPFWQKEDEVYDPINWDEEQELAKEKTNNRSVYYRYRNKTENRKKSSRAKNGDYIYTSDGKIKGVYFNGGVYGGGSETEEDDLYDEWKNLLLRESLAFSSLVKVKRTKASTFFTKGRLHELGEFIKSQKLDVIFINTSLSYVQKRNLEITFNNYLNEKNDRIRAYNIKSAMKIEGDATDTESNFSNVDQEIYDENKRIRVLDRFNIILSIFSQRAKSKTSQLQIELAYLKYIKTRLARGGNANFGALYKDFDGDFLNIDADFEVVSGKQSSGRGSIGGSGETQLEIEKRKISHRENQIKILLEGLTSQRKVEREKRRENSSIIPTVALVGYTNAGKTALINYFSKSNLDSENKLFQTLNTTIKKIVLPNKQSLFILDTVGFISDLPHELIESFKSTLEEVFYADMLLHVVDVSNPNHLHQKQVVYSTLSEIFPKNSNYKERIIEVWNKIDLLEDINLISGYLADSEFPIVPVSIKKSINIEMLITEIAQKMNSFLGKEIRALKCKPENYDKLFAWLKMNIGQPSNISYDENGLEMVLSIAMDEAEYQRYLENFVIMRENKRRQE
jgi:50S ribosomal subunit-associated GTPase HflX